MQTLRNITTNIVNGTIKCRKMGLCVSSNKIFPYLRPIIHDELLSIWALGKNNFNPDARLGA